MEYHCHPQPGLGKGPEGRAEACRVSGKSSTSCVLVTDMVIAHVRHELVFKPFSEIVAEHNLANFSGLHILVAAHIFNFKHRTASRVVDLVQLSKQTVRFHE